MIFNKFDLEREAYNILHGFKYVFFANKHIYGISVSLTYSKILRKLFIVIKATRNKV